jgi:sporulation protein YlmC with PRC-barrel domain
MNRGQRLVRVWVSLAVVLFLVAFSFPAWAGETKGKKLEQSNTGFRASAIIDHEVENEKGEELGEVDDLIIRRTGKVKEVILQVGGFLGIGDRLVAVQFRSLKIGQKEIIYSATREQLEKHPEFSYMKEGLYGFRYQYFGPREREGTQGRYYSPASPPYKHPYAPPWEWNYFPDRVRVSPILDSILLNYRGERLGTINDFIITSQGKVEKVIIKIEKRLVALPFKELEISYWGIYYDISRDELQGLPEFTYEEYGP